MHQHKLFCDGCSGEIEDKAPVIYMKINPCQSLGGSLQFSERASELVPNVPAHNGERGYELCATCWDQVRNTLAKLPEQKR